MPRVEPFPAALGAKFEVAAELVFFDGRTALNRWFLLTSSILVVGVVVGPIIFAPEDHITTWFVELSSARLVDTRNDEMQLT